MYEPQAVFALSVLAWFAAGAGVLTAIGRGPRYATTRTDGGSPTPPETVIGLGLWTIQCLVWPYAVYRWLRGFGEFNGHLAPECEHRIEAGDDPSKPWDLYRHGRACRRAAARK